MFLIKKLKKTIRAFLLSRRRRISIVRLNAADRILNNRKIVFNMERTDPNEGFIISGRILTQENDVARAAILAVNMFDSNRKKIVSGETLTGFSNSAKYGKYKYLPGTALGQRFHFFLPVPSETRALKLEIHAKGGANAILLAGATIERVSDISIAEAANLVERIDVLVARSPNRTAGDFSLHEVQNLLSEEYGKCSPIQQYLLLCTAFGHYAEINAPIAPMIGWCSYRLMPDFELANKVRAMLVEQGCLYLLRDFIDEVSEDPPFGWKHTSRRVVADIRNFEHGFEMPVVGENCDYKPGSRVFYLLHNSLPYNSGGYATRTHGLLTGIRNLGEFDPAGFSRPGYPSDHKKYISQSLPSVIPRIDSVDGVEYYRADQSIRKSSLTLEEYVEVFAKELEQRGREQRVRLIHAASNYPNGLAASVAARRLGVPSVYEVRGLWEVTRMSRQRNWEHSDYCNFMAKMEAEACRQADHVITITEALKDVMVERGVDREKISVVPNCVHVELFTPSSKRDEELVAQLNIAPAEVVIGYIGSVVNYEGLYDLLRAGRKLLDDGMDHFKILIVGDGAVLQGLKDLAGSLGITRNVIFTGRVPHALVNRYYSLVDITPFPREPFQVCEIVSPLKPFEALACGKAVLVSSCAALTEIIEHGSNGLVFQKGSYEDLADKLKLLINDQTLRSSLGDAGRAWVIKHRDWSNSARIVNSICNALCNK